MAVHRAHDADAEDLERELIPRFTRLGRTGAPRTSIPDGELLPQTAYRPV